MDILFEPLGNGEDIIEPTLEEDSNTKTYDITISGELNDSDLIPDSLPDLDIIDELPGVASFMPSVESGYDKRKNKQLTLKSANQDIKEFTDRIHSDRLERLRENKFQPQELVYDVQAVRLFGQTGSTIYEMAAYFGVAENTIEGLMRDKESDFYKVYYRANSLLHMSLRQRQIKTAMSGDTKMQIHLGKFILGQKDDAGPKRIDEDLSRDGVKRRTVIRRLTESLEVFDD